jgi:hypothetical protein
LLNEVSHLRIMPISLISCHYPWFSPGFWDLLKWIVFMWTFPYLSVSSASPSDELPASNLMSLIGRHRNVIHNFFG